MHMNLVVWEVRLVVNGSELYNVVERTTLPTGYETTIHMYILDFIS
jgi:hypothetical protein